MCHCCLALIYTTGYKVSVRLRYLVTHVPRTSLKSNIFLISSTCFFQDPSLDSPFSFAISHQGWGEKKRRCWRITTLVSLRHTKKKKKSSALLYFAKGFLAICHTMLLPQPMDAARQAQRLEVCPTPRGYLTNLFDVADSESELPHCSDHCDGVTQALPLLPGRDSVSVKAAMQWAEVGLLAGGWHFEVASELLCANESHRPPCGCYINRRSGRLLLPPVYLTACTMNDLSVRIAPNQRPGGNSAWLISASVSTENTFKPCLVFVSGCCTYGCFHFNTSWDLKAGA